jgi:anti-sigma regulatory factor (Ser/Thr protein kinase)
LFFSDGITEARNDAGQEFTAQAFLASLPVSGTAAQMLHEAVKAWTGFVGNASKHDDASLLLLDWRGLPPPAELTTTCCPENLALGRQFVERWAIFAGYDDVTTGGIVLACDEATTNVFSHGYERKPGPLKYRAEVAQGHLTIRIIDQARPVLASMIKGRSLSDLRPGGLGTFIMAKVFDEVNYEPQEIGTTLTLRKRLP